MNVILAIAVVLMLSLTSCSGQPTTSGSKTGTSESVTTLAEGVWPANEYTEGLPVPSGTVAWAALDTEHRNCAIRMTDLTENDYRDYRELLEQEGFSVLEDVSEEIKGQDLVFIGTLLSNGEKGLSLSYLPDCLMIYISFEESESNE